MLFTVLLALLFGLIALQYFVVAPREASRRRAKAIERNLRQQIIDANTERQAAAKLLKEAGQK